jgi:hypothetical protein
MDEKDFHYSDYCCWDYCSDTSARLLFVGSEANQNILDAVEKFLAEFKQFYLG